MNNYKLDLEQLEAEIYTLRSGKTVRKTCSAFSGGKRFYNISSPYY